MSAPTNPYKSEEQTLRCEVGTPGQVPTYQADGSLAPATAASGGGGGADVTTALTLRFNSFVVDEGGGPDTIVSWADALAAASPTPNAMYANIVADPDYLDGHALKVDPGVYIVTFEIVRAIAEPGSGSLIQGSISSTGPAGSIDINFYISDTEDRTYTKTAIVAIRDTDVDSNGNAWIAVGMHVGGVSASATTVGMSFQIVKVG